MKTTIKTIKGWANDSDLLFSENSNSATFKKNFDKYVNDHLKGFNKLTFNDTLKGKNAKEKVIIKGNFWRGAWSDPTKEIVAIFYK